MHQKTRPTVTYPSKPWQQRQRNQRRPASLPVGSYGGGRPPNPETRPRIYAAIVAYASEHGGNTPSHRQIQELANISSTSVVAFHIKSLIEDGKLEKKDGRIIVVGGTWTPPAGTVSK